MDAALERIELGDASASEARLAVSALLKEGSEASYGRLYSALGAWLWKALDGRRRDDELRQWFDIFRRSSAALLTKNAAYAERLRAFYDLLEMSIATSKVANVSEILSRQHVLAILRLLRSADGKPLEKAAIARKLGLKPANLSRILHMMANARLVERTTYGKEAHFCMTRDGAIALSKKEASAARPARPINAAQPARAVQSPRAVQPARPALFGRHVQPLLPHAPAQIAADAGELYLNLLRKAVHDPVLKSDYDHLVQIGGLPFNRPPRLNMFDVLQMLANHEPPTMAPPAPVPAQAHHVKVVGKRSYRGAQVVTANEKKSEAQRTHMLVEPVQPKVSHFIMHAYNEESENHVD
ncbi:helix-turn-helix domain-containing protein [Bradyrhizobium sp. U531]|uniref:helix-turn-helix transcriptional regulator n=1 Tax=Bradyrhizobium sp. U531 TaxID=3053458 RepID=UPI003F427C06